MGINVTAMPHHFKIQYPYIACQMKSVLPCLTNWIWYSFINTLNWKIIFYLHQPNNFCLLGMALVWSKQYNRILPPIRYVIPTSPPITQSTNNHLWPNTFALNDQNIHLSPNYHCPHSVRFLSLFGLFFTLFHPCGLFGFLCHPLLNWHLCLLLFRSHFYWALEPLCSLWTSSLTRRNRWLTIAPC